mmetsp:Transcript_8634/g.25563  ORF Transcript_8634/g.25563 Transcript_8634/m.25563 type:complete len:216 (+) Transcript_8634:3-650(+)
MMIHLLPMMMMIHLLPMMSMPMMMLLPRRRRRRWWRRQRPKTSRTNPPLPPSPPLLPLLPRFLAPRRMPSSTRRRTGTRGTTWFACRAPRPMRLTERQRQQKQQRRRRQKKQLRLARRRRRFRLPPLLPVAPPPPCHRPLQSQKKHHHRRHRSPLPRNATAESGSLRTARRSPTFSNPISFLPTTRPRRGASFLRFSGRNGTRARCRGSPAGTEA